MLREDFKVEKKEGRDYPPLPKDVYQVELLDVNSELRPTYDTRNKPENEKVMEEVLNFQFTLLEGKDREEKLRGRNVWANFIQPFFYISKKSGENKTLRIFKALLGRELTQQEEAEGVNGAFINSLVGKQCRVSVEPKTSNDKTFDNITDFLKANQELQPLTEEEKEKARVKKDKEEANQEQAREEYDPLQDPNFYNG